MTRHAHAASISSNTATHATHSRRTSLSPFLARNTWCSSRSSLRACVGPLQVSPVRAACRQQCLAGCASPTQLHVPGGPVPRSARRSMEQPLSLVGAGVWDALLLDVFCAVPASEAPPPPQPPRPQPAHGERLSGVALPPHVLPLEPYDPPGSSPPAHAAPWGLHDYTWDAELVRTRRRSPQLRTTPRRQGSPDAPCSCWRVRQAKGGVTRAASPQAPSCRTLHRRPTRRESLLPNAAAARGGGARPLRRIRAAASRFATPSSAPATSTAGRAPATSTSRRTAWISTAAVRVAARLIAARGLTRSAEPPRCKPAPLLPKVL